MRTQRCDWCKCDIKHGYPFLRKLFCSQECLKLGKPGAMKKR